MKDSKTILNRQVAYSLIFQIAIVVLLALPQLDVYRLQLEELSKLPSSAFWIPLLGILLLGNFLILSRIGTSLVEPLEELVDQTRLGASTIAFHKKSKNAEEDHLKHFIESQALRSVDLEQEVARMEAEVERISELSKISPEEVDALRDKVEELRTSNDEHSSQLVAEKTNSAKMEKEMLGLRRELKMRNRELETIRSQGIAPVPDRDSDSDSYDQDQNSPISILAEKLKTPLSLINNLSWRLAKSWADTSPTQVKEGLEEISKQAEEQLALIKKYQPVRSNLSEEEKEAN